jgi:AraC-like DNA-binding protein
MPSLAESTSPSAIYSPPSMNYADDQLTIRPKRVPMNECGIVVFESRHGPGFFGEMTDDYAKFHLLIAGEAAWSSGEQTFAVGADTLFHIAQRVPHRQQDRPGHPVTLYAIHYRPETLLPALRQELTAARMLPIPLAGSHLVRGRKVRRIVQEMLFEQEAQRFGWDAILQARLIDLAILALRARQDDQESSAGSDDSAARVAAYVRRMENEFFGPTTLDGAARSAGLSRRRFTELFRQHTGQSWRERILELRLNYAAHLLRTSERSVTAIAFECGFEDLSHFHRRFKARFRTTPHAFRHPDRPKNHS